MLIDELVAERKRLENLKQEVLRCLEQSPEGSLRITHKGGRAYYYHRERVGDKCGRYIPKKRKALAEGLACKDYALRLLEGIEQAEILIEGLSRMYCANRNGDEREGGGGVVAVDFVEETYRGLSEDRRSLVVPFEQTTDEFLREWIAQGSCEKPFCEGDFVLLSDKGERMRSKSEVLIANKLNSYGVPYRYEARLWLGEVAVYPDFLVLNKRTRKTYVWEHLGMMDDEEYAQKALIKVESYGRHGFVPGVDLVLTHERSRCPLDTRVVDGIIRGKLI